MSFNDVKNGINDLRQALDYLIRNEVDLTKVKEGDVTEFSRETYMKKQIETSLSRIKNNLSSIEGADPLKLKTFLDNIEVHYNRKDKEAMYKNLDGLAGFIATVKAPTVSFKVPKDIPYEIKEEVKADIEELEKSFKAGLYRAAIILCGRLLEVALHRKYYDATDEDLLEKSPGMGLGKIIAKLREKNVAIEAGLNEQIHLINQVRIASVHKKQQSFNPSKEQTQAIILYTLDVVEKLFK